jgi:predicted SAM-dependent methyltransferase
MPLAIKKFLSPVYAQIRILLVRRQLKNLLAQQTRHGQPLRIVIGAGGVFEKGWIPTDIGTLNVFNIADWRHYFTEDSVDAILAEHVWEHLTFEQGMEAARNCYKYLRPGAYLRVAVPDGFHCRSEYIDYVRPGGTGAGAADHKVLYNFKSFGEVFSKAGFHMHLLEYFDEKREFHCEDWNPEDGMICRSKRFDTRNHAGLLNYTSIILDARKPLR